MASERIPQCSTKLADKGYKIAFAESATAGWLASEFSLVEQSGKILLGGIVCYDAFAKEEIFGISEETVEKYTAESAEITKLIAQGLFKYFRCDVAVGITGLTTPGGSETPEKPVGTMFIHIIVKDKHHPFREVFSGSAKEIIAQTIDKVGDHLCTLLN